MRLIRISYETVCDGDEDCEDRGWINEEGVCVDPDGYDLEEYGDEYSAVVNCALKVIPGNVIASDYPVCRPGHTWYTDADGDINYATGEVTSQSYHLEGFSDQEERAIYSRLIG
jgi:hypothetical protein